MEERDDITGLLRELSRGRAEVLDRLMPSVYDKRRRIAHAQLRRERPEHTLNTTALVHEAYLKLVNVRQVEWRDHAHFFAVAARLMRRILIDYARARQREKRGGDAVHVPLAEARSEEHTSELQSRLHLVCRLLLEKKKPKTYVANEASNNVSFLLGSYSGRLVFAAHFDVGRSRLDALLPHLNRSVAHTLDSTHYFT